MAITISAGAKKADLTEVLANLAAQNAVLIQQNADLAEVIAALQVPAVNGSGNTTINQLIGNRSDDHDAETIFATLHDIWEGWHHEQLVYPTLAGAVTVTGHANAWTLGNFAEIVPANTIIGEFHIHHVHIVSPSANGEYELVLYNGTTEMARCGFSRTDKKDDVEGLDVITSHCAANSQIQARLASDSGGDNAKVKLWYHLHS